MVKRLIVGLLFGGAIGALVAFGFSRVVHGAMTGALGVVLAYAMSAVVGAITGLICGKPIWASEGKIEAGLKAFFGALLAAGGMFAIRRWGNIPVDLSALKLGQGALGDMPIVSLPLIAAVLGGFFELDNTPAPPEEKKRIGTNARVSGAPSADDEDEAVPAQKRRSK